MRWTAEIRSPTLLKFTIEEETLRNLTDKRDERGFYLYVYDGKTGINTHDYLQDTLDIAKQQALEDFGVPLDSWVEVAEGGLESQA